MLGGRVILRVNKGSIKSWMKMEFWRVMESEGGSGIPIYSKCYRGREPPLKATPTAE